MWGDFQVISIQYDNLESATALGCVLGKVSFFINKDLIQQIVTRQMTRWNKPGFLQLSEISAFVATCWNLQEGGKIDKFLPSFYWQAVYPGSWQEERNFCVLMYTAKNATDLLQVVYFTCLLQLVNKLQKAIQFY